MEMKMDPFMSCQSLQEKGDWERGGWEKWGLKEECFHAPATYWDDGENMTFTLWPQLLFYSPKLPIEIQAITTHWNWDFWKQAYTAPMRMIPPVSGLEWSDLCWVYKVDPTPTSQKQRSQNMCRVRAAYRMPLLPSPSLHFHWCAISILIDTSLMLSWPDCWRHWLHYSFSWKDSEG